MNKPRCLDCNAEMDWPVPCCEGPCAHEQLNDTICDRCDALAMDTWWAGLSVLSVLLQRDVRELDQIAFRLTMEAEVEQVNA